jgi:hypothetical protein
MIFRFKGNAKCGGIPLKLNFDGSNPRSWHPFLIARRKIYLHLTCAYFFEKVPKIVPVLLDFIDRYAYSFKEGFQRQFHGNTAYVCDDSARFHTLRLSGDRLLRHLSKFAGK